MTAKNDIVGVHIYWITLICISDIVIIQALRFLLNASSANPICVLHYSESQAEFLPSHASPPVMKVLQTKLCPQFNLDMPIAFTGFAHVELIGTRYTILFMHKKEQNAGPIPIATLVLLTSIKLVFPRYSQQIWQSTGQLSKKVLLFHIVTFHNRTTIYTSFKCDGVTNWHSFLFTQTTQVFFKHNFWISIHLMFHICLISAASYTIYFHHLTRNEDMGLFLTRIMDSSLKFC